MQGQGRFPCEMTSVQIQKVKQQPARPWGRERALGQNRQPAKTWSWSFQGTAEWCVWLEGAVRVSCSETGNGQHSGPRSRDRAWLGLHRGLGEKPGSCCGYEAGLAGERKGQAGQDRARAARMGCAKQSEDSSEDRAWALTIGLTHTTKHAVCLFCGASYRTYMPITHHGGLARGIKSGQGLTV